MFEISVGYSIREFVESLLKKRFSDNVLKQEVNSEDPSKLNFACPYCGDSEKDPSKKRGNLFFKTGTYKCFNDGCMKYVPLRKFVEKYSRKYNLPIPDVGNSSEKKLQASPKKKGFLFEFFANKEIGESLLNFNELAQRFSLYPASEVDPESPIGKYITKRKLHHLPTFEKSCYYDSRQDKIYLFNLDNRSGKVLGLAIRHINDSGNGPKYDIRNYSKLKESGLIRGINEEVIKEVDAINNYFNIFNVKFNKPITITEGQIDCMFLDNAIATTGVTKGKTLLKTLISKKNARILFDNDNAGREAAIALLKEGYSVFLWTKLLYSLRIEYPGTAKVLSKVKDVNDLYIFLSTVDSSLTYESFNSRIAKYFSNSQFDIILV